jgi:hypothetical protein
MEDKFNEVRDFDFSKAVFRVYEGFGGECTKVVAHFLTFNNEGLNKDLIVVLNDAERELFDKGKLF